MKSSELPEGAELFDVEDIPVAVVRTEDGGAECIACDVPGGRPFPWSSLWDRGMRVSADAFDALPRKPD